MSQEEADQVHKMLEEFRDEVNEEKVLRRLGRTHGGSEGWALQWLADLDVIFDKRGKK